MNKFCDCFPERKCPVKRNQEQWIDTEIMDSKFMLFQINEMKSKFPLNSDIVQLANKAKVKYDQLLRRKRMSYNSNQVLNSTNKSGCMWRIINTELGRTCRERVDFTELVRDGSGRTFASKQQLLDTMNDEFVSAATRCGARPPDAVSACLALSARGPDADVSMRLRPFTPQEIVRIATTDIAPKKSTDIYGLSASLLRSTITSIAHIICHLLNMCLSQGTYPSAIKKVKIAPLYKGKGKKSDMSSYRPISLVPVVSKLFEVGVNRRLLNFMGERKMLSERQFAYQPGKSTTDLVREVVWCVLSAREAGKHVALVCCDLSRAFDTADHNLLAEKLRHYGVRGPTLSLLQSFMSERRQVVVGERGRLASSEMESVMGVPQGSCVSNTLFSLLLNDLPGAINNAEIYMYADDVAAVVSAATPQGLSDCLNETARQLDCWFRSNGLALNREKTCYMRFNLGGKILPPIDVRVGNTPLKEIHSTKLLGFSLDSALVWDKHIESVCARAGRACFALRRLAAVASQDAVRACYFATVHSVLTYGTELWGCASDTLRAFRIQKRAIRAMARIKRDVSCRDYFKKYSIMPLPCEYIYQIAIFTHANLHLFARKKPAARDTLRSNKLTGQLLGVTHKLSKSEKSVYVVGPTVYNRLPKDIKDAASIPIFKNRLRSWLLTESFYNFNDFLKIHCINVYI